VNKILLAAALLALGACNGADPPVGPDAVWRCDGGAGFSARMTASGNAEVVAGGQTYRLPGVQAGSGVRYFDGRVEYWEHGAEAMLNGAAGGPYENCAAEHSDGASGGS
jgi:membrane-bound inhibitor of C-type lysozyme